MDQRRSEKTEPAWMLQLLLDTISTRVFWKDRDSTYVGCNRLFADDAGYSSEDDIVGKSDYDMPWRKQADRYRADDSAVISSGVPKLGCEEPQTIADGSAVQVRTSRVPWKDGDGRIIGIIGIYEDITERKQAVDALRRSEEKYRELVQNANSIILRWGRDGRVHFFNEFAQTFFNYTEEEIVGRSVVGTIVPETETSGRDLQAMIEDICAHPEYHGTNVNENMRKNGERVWIAWTNKPVFDEQGEMVEILSVGLDITSRINEQQARQESEARYRSIFNSNVDAFLLFDTDGVIVDANARAGELYGCSRNQLIGICGRETVDPKSQHLFDDFDGMALGEWFQRESVAIRRDGSKFDVEVHGARLRYGGNDRLLAIVFDVSERKRSRELQKQKERLEARHARLKATSTERSGFFAGMSHELRTPITCILGFAQILIGDNENPVTPEQRDMLLRVSKNADRLLGMLNDLLSLSRLEARRVAADISEVDLALLVHQVAQSISPLASEKEVELVVSGLDEPLTVYTDDQKVSQILLNLLSNAIKSTDSGSVTVAARLANEKIELSVTDTGVGIPKSDRRKIFREFYTCSESKSEKAPGAGLGLTITKKLCELLGGKIRVESEVGVGSTFTVTLPNRRR